ncbi:MAG: hypothetical protein MHM6MM_002231 [Cercozoa sp. M6MM]
MRALQLLLHEEAKTGKSTAPARLWSELGDALNREGELRAARKCFERSNDHERLVRLLLQTDLQSACKIARHCARTKPYETVANHCVALLQRQQQQDESIDGEVARCAVEFLVRSSRLQEALDVAADTQQLSQLVSLVLPAIKDTGAKCRMRVRSSEMPARRWLQRLHQLTARQVALPQATAEDVRMAARVAAALQEVESAMLLLCRVAAHDNEALSDAIALVQSAHRAGAPETRRLLEAVRDSIVGEGVDVRIPPAETQCRMIELLLCVDERAQASQVATTAAKHMMHAGKYKEARRSLLQAALVFRKHGVETDREKAHIGNAIGSAPQQVQQLLRVVQCFLLAKLWARIGTHKLSASLLSLVCDHLSLFPLHASSILASAVIECQRAGLTETALSLARRLVADTKMREQLADSLRRKMERFVRHAHKLTENAGQTTEVSPCQYCSKPLEDMQMRCAHCQSWHVFCVATGTHLVPRQTLACPHCRALGKDEAMQRLVHETGRCPLCAQACQVSQLTTTPHFDS